MPRSEGDAVSPVLTDTLVTVPDQQEVEEEGKPIKEEDSNTESGYDSDNTVTILEHRICLKQKIGKRENKGYAIMFTYIVYCMFITYT